MTNQNLPSVQEQRRLPAQTIAPQALAWHDGALWIGSRDLRLIYIMKPQDGSIVESIEAPGIPWAAVSTGDSLVFTIGEGTEDDRYLWRYVPGTGFSAEGKIACPDLTGSYLSFDGDNLYLSQWYKGRILQLDRSGNIVREFSVGAEISGHAFVDGSFYVLRGTEQLGESWKMARFDPRDNKLQVTEIATVPFACRSLTFDGKHFWANHRAANEVVCFTVPN